VRIAARHATGKGQRQGNNHIELLGATTYLLAVNSSSRLQEAQGALDCLQTVAALEHQPAVAPAALDEHLKVQRWRSLLQDPVCSQWQANCEGHA
jgi:hypothetical protein